jgi:hypothetical protein
VMYVAAPDIETVLLSGRPRSYRYPVVHLTYARDSS